MHQVQLANQIQRCSLPACGGQRRSVTGVLRLGFALDHTMQINIEQQEEDKNRKHQQ